MAFKIDLKSFREASANAEKLTFLSSLFAAVDGFDLEAAISEKKETALADYIAGLKPTGDSSADLLAKAQADLAAANASLENANAVKASLGLAVDRLATVLGIEKADIMEKDADALAAFIKERDEARLVSEFAALGVKVEDDKTQDPDPVLTLRQKYDAMPAGPDKRAFLQANKAELLEEALA